MSKRGGTPNIYYVLDNDRFYQIRYQSQTGQDLQPFTQVPKRDVFKGFFLSGYLTLATLSRTSQNDSQCDMCSFSLYEMLHIADATKKMIPQLPNACLA